MTTQQEWIKHFKGTNRNIFNRCISSKMLIELIIENTPKGGRLLEAGCGSALLSLILADYGFQVTALDLTEDILEYARSRMYLNNVQVNFVQGDILKLSSMFEKEYFDATYHSGVMEHFNDADIIRSLSEQRIVSKKVIFSVPNSRTKVSPRLFGDERLMNNKKWMGLIRAAGFKEVKLFGGSDLPKITYFVLPNVFFIKRGSFWWKWFSRHSIFVCE